MTTPPTPQPQPAPLHPLLLLAEQWEAWGGALDPVLDELDDLAAGRTFRQCAAQLREALRAQAAALAAAEAERDALRAALERIEGEAVVFEVCYRGALRDMDGWHGPLAPEDSTSMGIMPAITAALEGQS